MLMGFVEKASSQGNRVGGVQEWFFLIVKNKTKKEKLNM